MFKPIRFIFYYLSVIVLALNAPAYAENSHQLLERGWKIFVKDDDTEAIRYFEQALIAAERERNTAAKAQALLYMGICYYSMSYAKGLSYSLKAMEEYKKLQNIDPSSALKGRSKCLELISTIKYRQGKYRESIALSMEALTGFGDKGDSSGYPGIIFTSLGNSYRQLKQFDSSAYYYRIALDEHLRTGNLTYIPGAYINMAAIAVDKKRKDESMQLYSKALAVADSTGNRQGQVLALLGMGERELVFGTDFKAASDFYLRAEKLSLALTDKAFLLKTYEHLLELCMRTENYREAMAYQQDIINTRDSLLSWDRQKEIRSLEIQFDVVEKERKLRLIQEESKITTLTNYLLWGGIGIVIITSVIIILALRRINKRDQTLLKTKEALVVVIEEKKQLAEEQQMLLVEQKKLREQQLQYELEFKESQLSALTLQMLQKNELMQELKERLDEDQHLAKDQKLNKIINKGLTKDKEWSDFNMYFENVNTQFYTRLKKAYPEISPNELKLCALIKLHLSIKEMAAILNISPDSVKTARYRLRKKLQLNTEDSLADFILGL